MSGLFDSFWISTANSTCTHQLDKLTISSLGFVAQRRLARGVKLNHPEAVVSFTGSSPSVIPQVFLSH